MHKFTKTNIVALLLAVMTAVDLDAANSPTFTLPAGENCTALTITSPSTSKCSASICGDGQAISIDAKGVVNCRDVGTPVCTLSSSFVSEQGSVTLVANCPGTTGYSWTSDNPGFTPPSITPGTYAINVQALATPTTYYVKGINGNGLSAVAASVTVPARGITTTSTTTNSTTTTTLAATAPPNCTLGHGQGFIPGVPSIQLTATCVPAANSYAWSANTGYTGSNSSVSIPIPTSTQTYTVQGTNSAGTGNAAQDTYEVLPLTPPSCTVSASQASLVPGDVALGSSVLTATCSPIPTAYEWKLVTAVPPLPGPPIPPTLVQSSANPATADITTILKTTPGDYTYTVVASNVAGKSNASTNVTVQPPPRKCTLTMDISVVAGIDPTVGKGEPASLTAYCSPDDDKNAYIWTSTDTSFVAPNPTDMTKRTIKVNPTAAITTYTITGYEKSSTPDILGTLIGTFAVRVAVASPSCTLTADPSSLYTIGGTSILTASCYPMPSSYNWTASANAVKAGGSLTSSNTSKTATVTLPNGVPVDVYTYSVQGTNGASGSGVGNVSAATVTVKPPPTTSCGTSGNQLIVAPYGTTGIAPTILNNTIVPVDIQTQSGQVIRWTNSAGESRSAKVRTPDFAHEGNFQYADDPIGQNVPEFMNVSINPCDFKYENIYGNRCAISGGTNAIRYFVQTPGTFPPNDSYCVLQPGVDYYVNIRNETAMDPSVRGYDSCPKGVTCGFVFQVH